MVRPLPWLFEPFHRLCLTPLLVKCFCGEQGRGWGGDAGNYGCERDKPAVDQYFLALSNLFVPDPSRLHRYVHPSLAGCPVAVLAVRKLVSLCVCLGGGGGGGV